MLFYWISLIKIISMTNLLINQNHPGLALLSSNGDSRPFSCPITKFEFLHTSHLEQTSAKQGENIVKNYENTVQKYANITIKKAAE